MINYANDEVFNLGYKANTSEEKKGTSFGQVLKRKNKFLKFIILITIFFSLINVMFIYSFCNILSNI